MVCYWVEDYSSADRQSETPANTLTYSRCWAEICELKDASALRGPLTLRDATSLGMTLGERIQYKCGCSTGNSCYWSSSASTDKNAIEFIDYTLNGPCVVSSVQILPYRVFWHPGSPTYAPQKVRFEFYESDSSADEVETEKPEVFYKSPNFDVLNDMTLQEFPLPAKVMATPSTVLRIVLIGRHQAQTFELPQWLQHSESDAMPKYYCCLSYVNVLGLPWEPATHSKAAVGVHAGNLSCRAAMTFTEYMTSCYNDFVARSRRGQ